MINCSEHAAKYIASNIPKRLTKLQECFYVLALNAENKPISKPKMIAMGTANKVDVHPRDIFRFAIQKNAVSIIISHNHPSGNLVPSKDDLELTERVKKAGELLGIPVLDHIVLAPGNDYLSLADRGEF